MSKIWEQSYPKAPTFTEQTIPDQEGKVFLVTGANAGVGYHVASILYSKHGKVYLAARSEGKATEAISSIKEKHPESRGQLIYLHLDLADLTTIKKSAEAFLAQETQLNWLCNNAGVMMPPQGSKGAQGHELQYSTNVLGPFLFTKLLLPILKKTAETAPKGSVRVSWAASLGVEFSPKQGAPFEADGSPKDFGGGASCYQATKVANWWLAYEFGKRFGNTDSVLHNAFNPGNLKSELYRHAKEGGLFMNVVQKVLETVYLYPSINGAYTELYSGLSDDFTLENDQGAYVVPWGRIDTERVREDIAEGRGEGKGSEKLWNWCEKETQQYA